MGRRALNLNERLFVDFYLGKAKGNATQAAAMAGYGNPGQTGSRLVKKAHILRAIESKVSRICMSQEEVLARVSDLARTDMADFLRFSSLNGPASLDLIKAKRKQSLGGIKKLKASRIDRGEDDPLDVVEVELHSPIEALKLLMKYHKLIDAAKEDGAEKGKKPISEALDMLRARQRERERERSESRQ